MGRPKKKMSVAAPPQAKEISPGDNPPVPRKRGRPRKIVQEAVKPQEPQSTEVKKQKTSEEATEINSMQKRQTDSSTTTLGENGTTAKASLTEEPVKAKAVKREGSRRKSEPRRAAESFIAGR